MHAARYFHHSLRIKKFRRAFLHPKTCRMAHYIFFIFLEKNNVPIAEWGPVYLPSYAKTTEVKVHTMTHRFVRYNIGLDTNGNIWYVIWTAVINVSAFRDRNVGLFY